MRSLFVASLIYAATGSSTANASSEHTTCSSSLVLVIILRFVASGTKQAPSHTQLVVIIAASCHALILQAFLAGKATAGLTLAGLRALSKGVTPPDLDSLRVSAPLCISTAGQAS
jgi:hypothetical protein